MSFLRRFTGRIGAYFSSPQWARWGGVSLVVAGLIGFVTIALLFALSARDQVSTAYPGSGYAWMEAALFILWPSPTVFVFVGLIGVLSLLGDASPRLRWTALAGVAMASIPTILWPLYGLSIWLREPSDPYYSSSGFFNSEEFIFFMGYGSPIGIVLVGVAALQTRGLGKYRYLPIIIGVLSTPFVSSLIFRIYTDGNPVIMAWSMWLDVFTAMPMFLSSLGWILFGVVMFGAKERGERIVARERQATEERNLALARRLYEQAWGEEKLSVVDDIASEDFFDKRRNRNGSAAFKHAISDLHHAFPDLETDITEQTAEGDAVTTRIIFSGTDKGGVLWYPPTGKTATFTGTFTDRFEDGKLVEHDGEMDEETLMEQLGLPSEK